MTFKDFDAGGAAEDGGEQRRVVDVGVAGEGGVQREEALHLLPAGARHLHVAHRRAVVQRVDREKSRNFLSVLVNIFQEESVGPDR